MRATNRLKKDIPLAPGVASDRLLPPADLDRDAVLRALDRERLAEAAPDVRAERLRRIARLREEIRRGVYATEERVAIAIARAIAGLWPRG